MTIAGVFILVCYMIGLFYSIAMNKLNRYEHHIFLIMLWVSMFINIGYVFDSFQSVSYTYFMEIFFIVTAMLNRMTMKSSRIQISKKKLYAVGVFLLVIILSWLNLMFNPDMPDVISYGISMDSVYKGINSAQQASFGRDNLVHGLFMLLFLIICLFSLKYFTTKEKCEDVVCAIIKMFQVAMILWIIELVFCNVVSNTAWREGVFQLFGKTDKTLRGAPRYGIYGFIGLFTEPSYISIMLIYYIAEYFLGINKRIDVIFHWISLALVVLCGSTTGVMFLPLGLFVWFFPRRKKIMSKGMSRLFGGAVIVCAFIAIVLTAVPDILQTIIQITVEKMSSYFNGIGSSVSGATRAYGNSVAFNAFFESPLLGVGLGTTRGYGAISGMLACFGIIGSTAYIYMVSALFKINYRRTMIVSIIIVAYSYLCFSVYTLYSATVVALFIVMAYGTFCLSENTVYVQNLYAHGKKTFLQ